MELKFNSTSEMIALAQIIDIAVETCGISSPENYAVTKNGLFFADKLNTLLMESENQPKEETEVQKPVYNQEEKEAIKELLS